MIRDVKGQVDSILQRMKKAEMENKEIAVLLEITDSAATRRYYRALRHLKDALKQIPGMLD